LHPADQIAPGFLFGTMSGSLGPQPQGKPCNFLGSKWRRAAGESAPAPRVIPLFLLVISLFLSTVFFQKPAFYGERPCTHLL
jgi:hypothetical protein